MEVIKCIFYELNEAKYIISDMLEGNYSRQLKHDIRVIYRRIRGLEKQLEEFGEISAQEIDMISNIHINMHILLSRYPVIDLEFLDERIARAQVIMERMNCNVRDFSSNISSDNISVNDYNVFNNINVINNINALDNCRSICAALPTCNRICSSFDPCNECRLIYGENNTYCRRICNLR